MTTINTDLRTREERFNRSNTLGFAAAQLRFRGKIAAREGGKVIIGANLTFGRKASAAEEKRRMKGKKKRGNVGGGPYYLKGDPGEPLLLSSLSFSVCFFRLFSTLSLFSPLPSAPASPSPPYSHTHTHAHRRTLVFTYFCKRGSFIRGPLSPATPVNERGMAILCMNEITLGKRVHTPCACVC